MARGLSDYLILPWSGIVSQQWETRSTAHEQFVASLLADFAPVKDHLSRFNGNPELVERGDLRPLVYIVYQAILALSYIFYYLFYQIYSFYFVYKIMI